MSSINCPFRWVHSGDQWLPAPACNQASSHWARDPVGVMLQALETEDEIVSDLGTVVSSANPPTPPNRSFPGTLVPQIDYTTSHREWTRQPSIWFNVMDNPIAGISICDILDETSKFVSLEDRDMPFETDAAVKTITFRVLWPGYMPKSKVISPLDWTEERRPKPRGKIAHEIARMIQNLFEDSRQAVCQTPGWSMSNGEVTLEEIWLTALHHVSPGSWQPELYRVPRGSGNGNGSVG